MNLDHSKISVDYSLEDVSKYIKNKETTLLETTDPNIQMLVFWKTHSVIFAVVETDKIEDLDYSKYTLRDMLDNTLSIDWKEYRPISVLAKSDYRNKNYSSEEHLWMETLESFRWKWLMKEMFKVKELVDWILNKSVETIVSNIHMLLKNWYKVVWKVDNITWIETPFNWQLYIEKIISIKMKNWKTSDHLDYSYVFEKD